MERKAQIAEEKVVTVLHSTQKRQAVPLGGFPISLPPNFNGSHFVSPESGRLKSSNESWKKPDQCGRE